jgi:hypothetical protein
MALKTILTECLKITTFKIVFTFDVFFSAETTMHCKMTCILYKKQAHFSRLYSFPSCISALFLFATETDAAILLTTKLPGNREYIKIQEWL